jgi:hypothetical protein
MTQEAHNPQEKERQFYRFLIEEYLKFGSVDEIFRRHEYNLPISYPGLQRLVTRWGIVKAAGPNSKLSEAITFLVLLSDRKIPLERLYKSLPPSFKTSMATMHRILHHIKEGIIRRVGTALVVTPHDNPNLILVGEDVSTPRLNVGKPFGSISLPMGYSKASEEGEISVLRVLQHEVLTQMAINKTMPLRIIPRDIKPFMYLDVADVRVGVYHLVLPENLSPEENFSSYKLINHAYLHLSEIIDRAEDYNFRTGVKEIARGYRKFRIDENPSWQALFEKSNLNIELEALAAEYLEAA